MKAKNAIYVFLVLITAILSFNIFNVKDKLLALYAVANSYLSPADNLQNKTDICKLNFYTLTLQSLLHENKELKSLLNYKDDKSYLARIVDFGIEKNFYRLSYGVSDGEHIAIAPNSFALGSVSYKNLYLFSAPDRKLRAYLLVKDNKTPVELEGLGNGSFKFELNKDYKIQKGDLVYFDIWPVAEIVDFHASDKEAYSIVYAKLPYNLSNFYYVLLKPYEF